MMDFRFPDVIEVRFEDNLEAVSRGLRLGLDEWMEVAEVVAGSAREAYAGFRDLPKLSRTARRQAGRPFETFVGRTEVGVGSESFGIRTGRLQKEVIVSGARGSRIFDFSVRLGEESQHLDVSVKEGVFARDYPQSFYTLASRLLGAGVDEVSEVAFGVFERESEVIGRLKVKMEKGLERAAEIAG